MIQGIFYFSAFNIVIDNNISYLLKHDHESHSWKSNIYKTRSTNNSCCNYYKFNGFSTSGHLYLMDQFPNDPNEFWDTDGDGIGDNSDSDIDQDGYSNSNDQVVYDSRDHLDTDQDGIADSLDDNIDEDNFLNFDDPNPLVKTPDDGGSDSDRDGFFKWL